MTYTEPQSANAPLKDTPVITPGGSTKKQIASGFVNSERKTTKRPFEAEYERRRRRSFDRGAKIYRSRSSSPLEAFEVDLLLDVDLSSVQHFDNWESIQLERDFWQERYRKMELERDAWRDKTKRLVELRETQNSALDVYQNEQKEIINSVKSILISMENATTAKLSRRNPNLSKIERIQFSNQTFKMLLGSVKSCMETKSPRSRVVAGSKQSPGHVELKNLFNALLVKFGSAMVYANNQAATSNQTAKEQIDEQLLMEYQMKIDDLNFRLSEVETSRNVCEQVKKLLFTQVQQLAQEIQSRTSELHNVYKNLETVKRGKRRLEVSLEAARKDVIQMNLEQQQHLSLIDRMAIDQKLEEEFSGAIDFPDVLTEGTNTKSTKTYQYKKVFISAASFESESSI